VPDARHKHEHIAPERTTPQGTQAQGVEHGHEAVDVDFRSLFFWFGGLAAGLAITFLGVMAAYGWWFARAGRHDTLPSQVFAQQQTPPLPRLLPNPTDFPGRPLPEPPVIMRAWRESQQKLAQKYGLADAKTGLPVLPDSAATAVLSAMERGRARGPAPTAPPSGMDALHLPMPSGSSGGTAPENRLR
jgi:hypothetical protein